MESEKKFKWKDTLNLPKTSFPMKAQLSRKEPELLKFWEKNTETKNGGALYFSKEPVRIYGKKSYYMIHESGEIRAIQKNVSD